MHYLTLTCSAFIFIRRLQLFLYLFCFVYRHSPAGPLVSNDTGYPSSSNYLSHSHHSMRSLSPTPHRTPDISTAPKSPLLPQDAKQILISYVRAEASQYALDLKVELEGLNFSVYLVRFYIKKDSFENSCVFLFILSQCFISWKNWILFLRCISHSYKILRFEHFLLQISSIPSYVTRDFASNSALHVKGLHKRCIT